MPQRRSRKRKAWVIVADRPRPPFADQLFGGVAPGVPLAVLPTRTPFVAQLLPFPVSLEADMGGEFVLQINLGGTAADDPTNRAGIDPESTTTPVWWIDLAAERQEISTLTLDAAPSRVADWIVATAAAHGLDAGVRS